MTLNYVILIPTGKNNELDKKKWAKQNDFKDDWWKMAIGKKAKDKTKYCRCHWMNFYSLRSENNKMHNRSSLQVSTDLCLQNNFNKFKMPMALKTYAIFSDGERHGTSSSSSSSLSSHSSPSSLPDILNDDDVNISGTGNIDGRLLPVKQIKIKHCSKYVKNTCEFGFFLSRWKMNLIIWKKKQQHFIARV